jgi:hypothetical protein
LLGQTHQLAARCGSDQRAAEREVVARLVLLSTIAENLDAALVVERSDEGRVGVARSGDGGAEDGVGQ